MGAELRQMRYFVAVAQRRSFTRAAEDVFVAQQALSQQIKALEDALGVRLLVRNSRRVELTPAGATYLADCKRLLAAAQRAEDLARAVASGRAGRLRVAYTLTAAYDVIPPIIERLAQDFPELKVESREVFSSDIRRLLQEERCDLAVTPMTAFPKDLTQQTIRREILKVAVSDSHPLAGAAAVDLLEFKAERFELWPREMSPGYYDAVVGACRTAGFEPTLDETASGTTAWANIAAGRGVNLVVSSLAKQLPRGITLVDLRQPCPRLHIDAVWRTDRRLPAVDRFIEACDHLAQRHHWL